MNIFIPKNLYEEILNHCVRKLNSDYFDDETQEQQAFGGIIGKETGENYIVTKVVNWKKNYRYDKEVSEKMNDLISEYAIPGELSISERAWAVDPLELNEFLSLAEEDETFIGTYHMHHDNSWVGNYSKELASELDRKLAKDSEIINFIVYIGKDKRQVRAFYESKLEKEYNINIIS